jgi:hypothetical protein
VNQYLTGSLLIATFESWSLTFSIPWALDFTWESGGVTYKTVYNTRG